MSLTEPLARWIRLQRELGVDEVIFDAPLALPAPSASSSPRGAAPVARPAPTRPAPPPARPNPEPPRAAPMGFAPPAPPSQRPLPGSAPRPASTPAAAPPSIAPPSRPAPAAGRSAIPTFASLAQLTEHANACTRCVLATRRRSHLATGGPEMSTWAILTLYAWGEDSARGGLLAGDYARGLLDLARSEGLPPPAVSAIFACTPDDPADTTVQGFTEAVRCRGHWLQRLKLSGAKAVLVLDHKATQLARGPQGAVAWPGFRGQVWDLDGMAAISTHHPSRMARQANLAAEVTADLQAIRRLVEASR